MYEFVFVRDTIQPIILLIPTPALPHIRSCLCSTSDPHPHLPLGPVTSAASSSATLWWASHRCNLMSPHLMSHIISSCISLELLHSCEGVFSVYECISPWGKPLTSGIQEPIGKFFFLLPDRMNWGTYTKDQVISCLLKASSSITHLWIALCSSLSHSLGLSICSLGLHSLIKKKPTSHYLSFCF